MLKDDQAALSRRAFVGKVAGGAAGAAVAVSALQSQAGATAHHERETVDTAGTSTGETPADKVLPKTDVSTTSPPPWELLQPLEQGSKLAEGWSVQDLSDLVDGSAVLTLENERGRTSRLHICRNGGQPQGLVYTDGVDLVVMNGGQGDLPTEEGLGRAVAEVAHVIASNEKREGKLVTALQTQNERVAKFADTARLR